MVNVDILRVSNADQWLPTLSAEKAVASEDLRNELPVPVSAIGAYTLSTSPTTFTVRKPRMANEGGNRFQQLAFGAHFLLCSAGHSSLGHWRFG